MKQAGNKESVTLKPDGTTDIRTALEMAEGVLSSLYDRKLLNDGAIAVLRLIRKTLRANPAQIPSIIS